jgi:hypothetical protein
MAEQRTEVAPREEQRGVQVKETSLVPATAIGQALSAAAMAEVRLMMEFALAHPRVEENVMTRLSKVCKRPRFADKALYAFPRGNTTIVGASITLAQEMAKLWGNFVFGASITHDEGPKRTVRGFAKDLETNAKKELDITFDKLIYRKGKGWVEPDERDLLELTNRNGSKAARNCILGLLPWDLVDDAVGWCKATQGEQDAKDPDTAKKQLLLSFADLGVPGLEIVGYLNKPMEHWVPADITLMRTVYRTIRDGEKTWPDYVGDLAEREGVEGAKPSSADEVRRRVRAAAEAQGGAANGGPKKSTNQGGGK